MLIGVMCLKYDKIIMKKLIAIIGIALFLIALSFVIYNNYFSTTKIALVNFQPFQATSLIKSNTDKFVTYEEVEQEDLRKLGRYDFVLGFGMGMRISAEQRVQIQKAADKGTPVWIYAATNPENDICTLDSLQKAEVGAYLGSANRKNYQSLAHYIRKHIDKKSFFITDPEPPVPSAFDVLYHLDDNVWFNNVTDYENYLKEHKFYTDGAPKVAVMGGMNDPFGGNKENIDSLIVSLQESGLNVYPVWSMMKRLDYLEQIRPDAVIYFAHGRLAQSDAAVGWLKKRNIPIFSPVSILQTGKDWENDLMGMAGGMMSQSIVMPELDGAIYPYVINAQEADEQGLYLFKAIPDRLRDFTQIVTNFLSLKKKNNAEKKIAIYYFKGAGQETLTAQGLETISSLYNFLQRLRTEGYKVENLPATESAFEKLLMAQGVVLNTYAEGAFDEYLQTGKPALIEKAEYESWIKRSMPSSLYDDVVKLYGEAPGSYMSVRKDDGSSYLAIARIEFGHIALLPQPMAGLGSDAFAIVHGAKSAPPHTYIGAYLWAKYGFQADAMLHFGTHGSLEFTPQKQVALGNYDWPDRLVGTVPHFYYYTIGNVGESMMAKRRSYATTISYLTPPFMESNMRSQYKTLQDKIRDYYKAGESEQLIASRAVKKIAVQMGLHRELRLDSTLTWPYTAEDIERLENFAEEIANEKMTGQLYTTGIPYDNSKINSSVTAMSADPIAYSLSILDKQRGKVTDVQLKSRPFFTQRYLDPAKSLVGQVLKGRKVDNAFVCHLLGISEKELTEAGTILAAPRRTQGVRNMQGMPGGASSSAKKATEKSKPSGGGHPAWIPKFGKKPDTATQQRTEENKESAGAEPKQEIPEYTQEQRRKAQVILEAERTIKNIENYKKALQQSPELEIRSLLNALNGGYIAPTSGGDAVANPQAVPTGRNLYAINAEATPSEIAWDKGVALVNNTLEQYKKQHGDYPRKVSYTFWSSEFIETEGATLAQVFYMLGVEPVRDAYGRVSDLQLIPSTTLGRPRVDVIVQTSGQFRDLASSRLSLISRAVEMAASSEGEPYPNYVSSSAVEVERLMVEQGVPPATAREMSTQRIFGGVNGLYGTGIQDMVKSGDKWEKEKEIADAYIHNMGAVYGSEKDWGVFHEGLLSAVLHNTDVVVQPRQSNTWGALSLDHVFEFMGGMNLAVRNVTGKDPDAYFADYRNRNNVRMQELKEAIGVESRSTIFNPTYIKEVMKGKASSASQITEVVTNTYGWNVMKPDVIDNEMWDNIYTVYVEDSYKLGVMDFFKKENPYAMQEITAVMMETARKGMWKATEQQLAVIAKVHTDMVKEFGHSGAGFSGNNIKLQDFIIQKAPRESVAAYTQQINKMKTSTEVAVSDKGMVLKKDNGQAENGKEISLNGLFIGSIVVLAFAVLLFVIRQKRKW
jgi:cobaltochelatase CobN